MTTETVATHTPGPWHLIGRTGRGDNGAFVLAEMDEEYVRANASEDDSLMDAANERYEANAALICAAPALLAALDLALDALYDYGDSSVIRDVEAALALARGEVVRP